LIIKAIVQTFLDKFKGNNVSFILSNLAFLVFVNLIVKPFWIFGIELKVQNLLGAEIYGNYFALFNFVFLFGVLLDLGIGNYNNREISRHPEKLSEHFSNIVVLKFLLALFYVGIIFFFAFVLQYDSAQLKLMSLLLLNQVFLSYILFFRSNLGALQLFKQDSFMSVLDKLLMIFICSFMIWSVFFQDRFNITWFVIAQSLAYGFTALISGLFVFRQTTSFSLKINIPFFKKILLSSYPFALLVLLMSLYNRIDGVMLERLLPNGDIEAGIYAASYRLLDAVNQFGLLSATILLPVFAKMIKQEENVWNLARMAGIAMFVLSLLVAFFCWFLRLPIMSFLYLEGDAYYALIFGLLMFSFIGISSVYVFGTLLTANGSLRQLNFIAIGGVILNIFLNYFLIFDYGALGATWATLLTQSLVAIAHVILAWRVFSTSS